MDGFFCVIGPKRIKKTNPVLVKRLLGLMKQDAFVQPPRCEKCGGYVELGLDWKEGLVSCGDCGKEFPIFFYETCPIKM